MRIVDFFKGFCLPLLKTAIRRKHLTLKLNCHKINDSIESENGGGLEKGNGMKKGVIVRTMQIRRVQTLMLQLLDLFLPTPFLRFRTRSHFPASFLRSRKKKVNISYRHSDLIVCLFFRANDLIIRHAF